MIQKYSNIFRWLALFPVVAILREFSFDTFIGLTNILQFFISTLNIKSFNATNFGYFSIGLAECLSIGVIAYVIMHLVPSKKTLVVGAYLAWSMLWGLGMIFALIKTSNNAGPWSLVLLACLLVMVCFVIWLMKNQNKSESVQTCEDFETVKPSLLSNIFAWIRFIFLLGCLSLLLYVILPMPIEMFLAPLYKGSLVKASHSMPFLVVDVYTSVIVSAVSLYYAILKAPSHRIFVIIFFNMIALQLFSKNLMDNVAAAPKDWALWFVVGVVFYVASLSFVTIQGMKKYNSNLIK